MLNMHAKWSYRERVAIVEGDWYEYEECTVDISGPAMRSKCKNASL